MADGLNFEWDEEKSRSNYVKHGVTFDEACTVFADPLALFIADPDHSAPNDERFILLGESASPRLVVVVFVERDETTMRIISARKATPSERRRYEEGI